MYCPSFRTNVEGVEVAAGVAVVEAGSSEEVVAGGAAAFAEALWTCLWVFWEGTRERK